MEPTSSTFEWSFMDENDFDTETWTEPIYCSIIKIIETSKRLEALTLGCSEELVVNAGEIVERLGHQHGKHLTHLGLASVKEEPESYDYALLNSIAFRQFERLTVLTLDYDYLTDTMLESLTCGTLERLVIHVHNWTNDHLGTSDEAWQDFTQKNKRCELRLSLLHAYAGITVLDTHILRPAMPLTHFKALFCEYVNIKALWRLFLWYSQTLKSVVWIDSMDEGEILPPTDDELHPDSPDVLVLLAWKCHHLEELIYIGHKYYQENMLAIARLRGSTLQTFEFAESNIISEDETAYKFNDINQVSFLFFFFSFNVNQ